LITSKKLYKEKKITHMFFNRNGGKSEGVYKSLNCGIGSNDKKKKVRQNLKIVKSKFGKKCKNIFLVHQTHSNKFIFINKNYKLKKKRVKADAIITNQKRIPIAVLTADCVPLLLYDKRKDIIAAVHAGWKGAFKGIIKNVLSYMKKKGCCSRDIIAAIGPCIRQNSYNVKKDFQKKFVKKSKRNRIFFKKRKNKIYFNLPKFVESELKLDKITNIDIINKDTFIKKNNFFSARQSLRLKYNDYGRNISIIMIN